MYENKQTGSVWNFFHIWHDFTPTVEFSGCRQENQPGQRLKREEIKHNTEPLTRPLPSTEQDRRLCYRVCDSPASLRCSICCGQIGLCRHEAAARSEPSGFEIPGCRTFWYNAPSRRQSIWTETERSEVILRIIIVNRNLREPGYDGCLLTRNAKNVLFVAFG